jgi:hypothetical protein
MHLKTYLSLALVLLLSMGMGCSSSGTSSNAGGVANGGDPSLVGTWNLVSATGNFPPKVLINANGTGSYIDYPLKGINTSFTWTQSGNQVTVSTGSSQSDVISLPSVPVGNTFTLSASGATAIYTRA